MTVAGSMGTVREDNQYMLTFPVTTGFTQKDALTSILFDIVLEAIVIKTDNSVHT